MGKLRTFVTGVGQSLGLVAGDNAAGKSLRDGVGGTGGGDVTTTAGANVVVARTKDGNTARLFKKRNVLMLRNYAEYSTNVRSAIDIYRNCIEQAECQIVPADPKKPVNERVKRDIEAMLRRPNESGEPYSEIKGKFIEDFLVIGHGALEKAIRRDTSPYNIFPLDAARVCFTVGWDGTDQGVPRYAELDDLGQVRRWLPDAMAMSLVNRPRSYDRLGLSHVETLDMAVRALLEGDDHFLQQMIDRTPGGVLDLGEGFTKPQVDQFRAEIQQLRSYFAVMSGGKNAKFVPFNASERDVRMLDKLLYFKRQVAAIFQLPLASLGETVDTSRANTDALLENADKGPGALLWRIRGMEQAQIVERFGPVAEHNCMIDYPVMSRKDEKQQAEVSKTQTGGVGWVSINQAARDAGKPTVDLPIADEIILKTRDGYVPLSALNAQYFDGKKLREPEPVPAEGDKDDEPDGDDPKNEKRLQRKALVLGASIPFEHARKALHEYSTTQLDLPADVADEIIAFAAGIPDEQLADKGRETVPHVTVKFGLHTQKAADVIEALKGVKPVTITLGKTSLFESDDYDVLKVEVKGAALKRLNKLISDALDHTDTHPEYVPHATIAYLKPGEGAQYVGDDFLSGTKVTIDEVIFSTKKGARTVIKLEGGKEEK